MKKKFLASRIKDNLKVRHVLGHWMSMQQTQSYHTWGLMMCLITYKVESISLL